MQYRLKILEGFSPTAAQCKQFPALHPDAFYQQGGEIVVDEDVATALMSIAQGRLLPLPFEPLKQIAPTADPAIIALQEWFSETGE